ncbi:MAG TPA: hypothetical protein VFW40_13185, partial [Capsulimonadaceae bacterium]|nr:hypothetical protein [Capsulimonadaceae bacterium]
MFEELPRPGNQAAFARLTYEGMTFDFPNADTALRRVIRAPLSGNPEDQYEEVEGWPDLKVIDKAPNH